MHLGGPDEIAGEDRYSGIVTTARVPRTRRTSPRPKALEICVAISSIRFKARSRWRRERTDIGSGRSTGQGEQRHPRRTPPHLPSGDDRRLGRIVLRETMVCGATTRWAPPWPWMPVCTW